MAIDTHIRRGHPIVFGLLFVFGLIELAISAWLVSRYNNHSNRPNSSIPDKTAYTLFCCVWTVLFAFIYGALFWHSNNGSILTSVLSHAIFLTLTWIFWTAAAASVTAALYGGLDCNDTVIKYCGQLNALEAFAWIMWILVTVALVVVLIRGISASRRGDGMRGGLVA